jgi:hypothetical protein
MLGDEARTTPQKLLKEEVQSAANEKIRRLNAHAFFARLEARMYGSTPTGENATVMREIEG